MLKKNITKNYIFNLIYQILNFILPLITMPYVSRILGADGLGIFGYTLSISAYFILAGSLGINLYAQKEIAYVQDKKRERSILFWEFVILKIITMSIALIVFYFSFASFSQYNMYFKILCFEIFASMVDICWFFQGLEEFKKTVSRNILIRIILLTCIFIFVKEKKDLYIYFIIYVLSAFIGNLTLWLYIPRLLSNRINIKRFNILRHLRPTLILFIPQIAIQINAVLDKTMIGSIANNIAEVGFYDQSYKIIRILLAIITALGATMLPRISNYFAKNQLDKIKELLNKSANFVYFLGVPIMFGMIIISDKLVPIFFGSGYEKVSILIKLLSPIIIFIGLSNVLGVQYLFPTKRQKLYTISITIGTAINLILNILLIPKLLSIGSEIATVTAEFTVLAVQIYFVRKELDIKSMLLKFRNYLIGGLMILAVGQGLTYIIKNDLLCLILQILLSVIIYFTTLLILKDQFFFFILNKGKGLIIKKKNKKPISDPLLKEAN